MSSEHDYYFVETKNGKTYYYSRLTGLKTPKKNIPVDILPKINKISSKESTTKTIVHLIDKKDALKKKIEAQEREIEKINDQLSNMGINTEKDEKDAKEYWGQIHKPQPQSNASSRAGTSKDTNKGAHKNTSPPSQPKSEPFWENPPNGSSKNFGGFDWDAYSNSFFNKNGVNNTTPNNTRNNTSNRGYWKSNTTYTHSYTNTNNVNTNANNDEAKPSISTFSFPPGILEIYRISTKKNGGGG